MLAFECLNCLDKGFVSRGFDSVEACEVCEAGRLFAAEPTADGSSESAYFAHVIALYEDREGYARP